MRKKTVPIMALVREFQRMKAGEISEQRFRDYLDNTKITEIEALDRPLTPEEVAICKKGMRPPDINAAALRFLRLTDGSPALDSRRWMLAMSDDMPERIRRIVGAIAAGMAEAELDAELNAPRSRRPLGTKVKSRRGVSNKSRSVRKRLRSQG